MKHSPRPFLLFPGSNCQLRLSLLAGALGLLGFSAFAQTEPLPLKVVKVGEESSLNLTALDRSSARASRRHRFVTLDLEFAPSINVIETQNLVLVSADGQVFRYSGIADNDGRYCLGWVTNLTRKDDLFEGQCSMVAIAGGADIELRGGGIYLGKFSTKMPTAAFLVPKALRLSALHVSYSLSAGTVPTDPPALTSLPNGLEAEVRQVSEWRLPSADSKFVTLLVEVKNESRDPFRVHSATIQLHVPGNTNEKGELRSWRWAQTTIGAADMTGAAPQEQRDVKPVTLLAAGETRTLRLSFEVNKDVDAKRCELGFFREHTVSLVGASSPAPSATPKK